MGLTTQGVTCPDTRETWTPAFFHALLDQIHDPVYVIDPADCFRFCYVNAAACEHYGYSQAELMRMCIPDWDPNFPMAECDRIWERIRKERNVTIETLHKVAGGELVPVEVSANVLQFGGREYIAGLIRNVSARKASEDKIRELAEHLSRSNEELKQFAYVASHDLREPLATMWSYARLLEETSIGRIDPSATKWLGFVISAAERMRRLIDTLLEYSRVESSPLMLTRVDCNVLLAEIRESLRSSLQAAEGVLEIGALPTVVADEMQVARLFQNLVSNAIKYRGDRPAVVRVTATEDASGWVFHVHDNGIGIEEGFRSRIFRPFEKAHGRDRYEGTGLGLAICKKIVERHGGRIWFESAVGVGTTVSFWLPRKALGTSD